MRDALVPAIEIDGGDEPLEAVDRLVKLRYASQAIVFAQTGRRAFSGVCH